MTDWDASVPLPSREATLRPADGVELRRLSEAEPELWRLVGEDGARIVRLPAGLLRVLPVLPDEPLVLRFSTRLDVSAGAPTAHLFAGLPVNLRLEHVPETGSPLTVAHVTAPGLRRRLAVGRVDDPQMARTAQIEVVAAPCDVPEGLAVVPLRFLSPETGTRTLDRVMLPAGGLSLWAGGSVLYTSAVEVDLRESETVGVRILPEVPRPDVTLRFGPTSQTGEFSLRGIVRALTQFARGAE